MLSRFVCKVLLIYLIFAMGPSIKRESSHSIFKTQMKINKMFDLYKAFLKLYMKLFIYISAAFSIYLFCWNNQHQNQNSRPFTVLSDKKANEPTSRHLVKHMSFWL